MIDVIIALKALTQVKSRLSSCLSLTQRQALTIAMAGDVLECLAAWSACRSVTIVAGAGWHPDLLPPVGLVWIDEVELETSGLNGVLAAAARQVQGDRVMVLHGDLPWLCDADLTRLEELAQSSDVVLCPDHGAVGTNAIVYPSDCDLSLQFGSESFERYRAEVRRCGLRETHCVSHGLSRDVDGPSDVEALRFSVRRGRPVGPRTANWVQSDEVGNLGAPVATDRSVSASLIQMTGGR